MVNMEKTHKLRFKTAKGILELDTNDLEEVGRASWFAAFFSIGTMNVVHQQNSQSNKVEETTDWKQIAIEQNDKLQKAMTEITTLEEEKLEMKSKLKNELAKVRGQVEELQVIDENSVKELGKELEQTNPEQIQPVQQVQSQPIQQQAQQRMQQQQQPTYPGVRPQNQQSSFLNINPDQMNESVWKGLSAEQQQEWLKNYNLA